MQYVIKQVRAEGSEYWDGNDYAGDDVNDARFYNSREDAEEELAQMEKHDRHNALVIAVDPE